MFWKRGTSGRIFDPKFYERESTKSSVDCATLMHSTSVPWPRGLGNLLNVHRDRDRLLQLLILNEEFLVNAVHQTALITSLYIVRGKILYCKEKL